MAYGKLFYLQPAKYRVKTKHREDKKKKHQSSDNDSNRYKNILTAITSPGILLRIYGNIFVCNKVEGTISLDRSVLHHYYNRKFTEMSKVMNLLKKPQCKAQTIS